MPSAGQGRKTKKSLKPDRFKDERFSAPWYHLGSHVPSRERPLRVPTHPCAVTCAHVAAYAVTVGRATPRPCSADPSVPLFTTRGSLCRICPRTLLFIVFAVCTCVICFVVYTLSVLLSTSKTDDTICKTEDKIMQKAQSSAWASSDTDFLQISPLYRIETRR